MARKLGTTPRSLVGTIRARLLGAGIHTKTLGVVAVPMIFLLLLSAVVVGRSVGDTQRAGQVVQFAGVSTDIAAFVTDLQAERSTTMSYLRAPSATGTVALAGKRKIADSSLATVRKALTASSATAISPALRRAVTQAEAAHRSVALIRAGVDKATSSPGDVQRSYAAVLQADLALPDHLADAVTDPELSRTLRAYGAVSQLLEAAAQERDAIVVGAAARRFTPDQYAVLTSSVAAQNAAIAALGSLTTTQQKQRLNMLVAGSAAADFLTFRKTAVSASSPQALAIAPAAFAAAASTRLNGLRSIQTSYAASVIKIAEHMRGTARNRALLIAGLLAFAVAFPLLHAIVLSRRLVRPLRRLTESAEQIGAELPRMVQRMQQPGEDPDIRIEPIEIEGRDEVGRLAEAFNTVNEVTVQVAIEQAALRGSIAEMFVNVARRNQALLGRQLAFLDQLEADEEDPDALRNLFHLDHLAAQMRRNAESLLVLAGIDATRRLRAPMPLSDVIRTAIGEIDGFQRVDLSLDADPDVTGLRALSVAHLLAELLDNATHFSDPQTRVRVSASFDGDDLVVDVYDEGLGLSPEELADANHRLASPPATEIAVAQRLGFYVVGRIAQRLDIGVELKGRKAGGTVAIVTLPPALFVDGSLPVSATHRDEPAVASFSTPLADAPVSADSPVLTLLPVTDSRRRRHRAEQAKPRPAGDVPRLVPPLPLLEPVGMPVMEMPLAVQDILPGRKLRRLTMLSGQPTPSVVAPPAAAPTPKLPIPAPRVDAARPHQADTFAASPAPAKSAGPPLVTAPVGAPLAAPAAATVPLLQPAHSPMRANEAARSALAELSQLSAAPYKPSSFGGGGGGGEKAAASPGELRRRTPKPVAEPEPEPEPAAAPESVTAPSPRSAEQVRGNLSGFRAGVQRGRHSKDEPEQDQRNEEKS